MGDFALNDNFLLPVYLRKEERDGINGVACYADERCKEFKGFFPWWNKDCPTKRNKYITLNCYRWLAVWA